MELFPAVYIMSNKYHGTIYIGSTSNIYKRVFEHKTGVFDGFTKKYQLDRFVWFQSFEMVKDAIARERQMKEWRRDWKIRLIEEANPRWHDLSDTIAY